MSSREPISKLDTHEVSNQPTPLENYNLFEQDLALREALQREGAAWAQERLQAFGAEVGSERVIRLGFEANRYVPELKTFNRYGQRIDEVDYHPAYHELMALAIKHEIHSIAWLAPQSGGHVAHVALEFLLSQAEPGVCCPITMTYAAVPALKHQPEMAAEWQPRLFSKVYDERFIPADEKRGVTIGMAMTEKQGGSDVRSNTTRARPLGAGGLGAEYELTGHKWFCSAPMSDAFLTLANTGKGLSCFLLPRWRPDGSRNPFFIQRLKDKLGNRANASSEIEFKDSWACMVGEEGRGVATIIEMVHHTRLDSAMAAASLMRQAVVQATHHSAKRCAFGKKLSDQALMRNVLADLAIESEAATTLIMRVARAFDESTDNKGAKLFARIAVAVAKYWLNKRTPNHVYEALECHGGSGYVEESIMPRLYREAPLNSIWEGSGNVICLDVLRAMRRQSETIELFLNEVELGRGGNRYLDAALDKLRTDLHDHSDLEIKARRLTEGMALTLQASLLVQHAPMAVADAFCASRLGGDWGQAYGSLPPKVDFAEIIERARPKLSV